MPKWQKGCSGNPAGRPRGIRNSASVIRAQLLADCPDIIAVMTERAKAGDAAAAKLLLDRCLPALRPGDLPMQTQLASDITAAPRAVFAALASGELTPDEAHTIAATLASLTRVIESTELIARLDELEERIREQQQQPAR